MWLSRDDGASWRRVGQLTSGSAYNHDYVRRPVNAHPDFYGFWCDGDPDAFSPCRLYFTDKAGERVYRLPVDMPDATARPEVVEVADC